MAFSDVKIHYYQSMFRIRSRRFLVFAAMIPIACVLSSVGTAQVVSSKSRIRFRIRFRNTSSPRSKHSSKTGLMTQFVSTRQS